MIQLLSLSLTLIAGLSTASQAQADGFLKRQRRYPRVRAAERAHLPQIESDFRAAGAPWPPAGIFLRAYKAEGVIELWADPGEADEPWVKVRDFDICMASGVLGPKETRGDLQVPEGFYHLNRFNPSSRFHLSLGINYPNAVDRARAGERDPGGEIFIHGDCVTIGCMPLRDGPMSYLYVVAIHSRDHGQRRVPVHVHPCRSDRLGCQGMRQALSAAGSERRQLWEILAASERRFEAERRPPKVKIRRGAYVIPGGAGE